MDFMATQHTGSRLIGAITWLGLIGPKHHGLIIGELNSLLYVAESVTSGYQCVPIDDFIARYRLNGKIRHRPNNGRLTNIEVAQNAINEINKGGNSKYNLVTNNCESFVNRAMHEKSFSLQVITCIGLVAVVVLSRKKAA
jgi:hypothetical protein